MKTKECRGENGQAAVFITILLMFALIALTALAIDGGHLYVVRRDLQNMTDAGCLAAATELSLGGDDAAAIAKAKEYVINNGADFFTTWPVEEPNRGTGVGLTWGIEVTGADVRVALQKDVDTYFTMVFNRPSALVGARSHCNAVAGGGLLPIAVRRYEVSENKSEQTDFLANKYADIGWPEHTCESDDTCGYPADSVEHEWDGRYGTMKLWLPDAYGPISTTLYAMESGAIRGDVPPPDDIHEGVLVLGDGVQTNDGTADYKGFVLLDARNIANGPVEYLNGASGQSNTNKELSKRYFQWGYPQEEVPQVGDQLAMLDGVSNDFAAQEMAKWYRVGQRFVAVVYSGYIWESPDFEVSITPQVNASEPVTPTETVYTVTLEKVGPAAWPIPLNVSLSAEFMHEPEESEPITRTWEILPPIILGGEGHTVDWTLHVTSTVTEPHYVSAFTVEAYDSILGLKRWASANFRYGDIVDPDFDFTFYSSRREYHAEPGESLTVPLTAWGFGGGPSKNNVKIDGALGPECGDIIDLIGGKISIRDGQPRNGSYTLDVSDEVLAPKTCVITLSVNGAPQYPTRSVTFDLHIVLPSAGGEPKKFVIVEGFAPFEVSYVDANTVAAFAVGPIMEYPSEVIAYLNPRLVLWDR